MRITAGRLKGKKLFSPPLRNLRLTEEKVRKAIFDILREKVKHAQVIELFAGSGALGIEALSRGAEEVTFVDCDRRCIETIKKNIPFQFKEKSQIVFGDCLKAIGELAKLNKKFDLVILDPPYKKGLVSLTLKKLDQHCILKPYAIIVVEHHRDENFNHIFFSALKLISQKRYGETIISILNFVSHNQLSKTKF